MDAKRKTYAFLNWAVVDAIDRWKTDYQFWCSEKMIPNEKLIYRNGANKQVFLLLNGFVFDLKLFDLMCVIFDWKIFVTPFKAQT